MEPESRVIEVSILMRLRDVVRAEFLDNRPRPALKTVGIVVAAITVIAAIFVITSGDLTTPDFVFLGIILYLIYHFAISIPLTVRESYLKQHGKFGKLTYRFGNSGVRVGNENVESDVPWEDYLKWKESDQMILLYLSGRTYTIVPKRMFQAAEQLEAVRDLVNTRIECKDG